MTAQYSQPFCGRRTYRQWLHGDIMLNRTMSVLLLLVVATAFPCFAQDLRPLEPKQNDVMAFERDLEAAIARCDLVFLEHGLADDLKYTHGDDWIMGSKPALVDTKKSFIDMERGRGHFISRQVNAQQVELHGSIAITTGRIDVTMTAQSLNAGKSDYSVWFVRVYREKDDGWELVSHRTVVERNTM
jgi:ketosteroid isomerase-like protein